VRGAVEKTSLDKGRGGERLVGGLARFGSVRERALVFLSEYGEKGRVLLESIIEAYHRVRERGGPLLGDFDYRTLVELLETKGGGSRPGRLLRVLEREYDLIETSYKSSRQHWWIIRDIEELRRALEEASPRSRWASAEGGGHESARVEALRIRYRLLEPRRLLEELGLYESRGRLSRFEKEGLREVLKGKVDEVAELIDAMRGVDPEVFREELEVLGEILERASRLSSRFFS